MSEKKEKLNYGKTILMGFGFMASSIAWAIYDPYITKILNVLLNASETITAWSASLNETFPALAQFAAAQGENVTTASGGITLVPLFIGIIMTFDNIFGVIFQPTFGKLSDRCHSRLGKRRPFIVFGAPVAAALFVCIPYAARTGSIPLTMTFIILFVFIMSLWRAPVVALMPDLTPPALRSEGNAVINLMGGIGGLIGMIAGTAVTLIMGATGIKITAENESIIYPYVFMTGAAVMVIGMLVLLFFVKEPDSRIKTAASENMAYDEAARIKAEKEAKKAEKEALKADKLPTAKRVSLVFMLMALFFMFSGTNAIQTYFALFAAEILGKTTSEATIMMAVFAVASALAALPAGWVGKKIGRKKTILGGLVVFMLVFLLYLATHSLAVVWIALILGGAANMFITVNTLPLVLEIGGLNKVGTFTGYYYTATFSAQIASPIIYGMIRMVSNTYMSLFYYAPIMFAISLLCLLVVRHGEAVPDEVVKEAQEA